MAYEAEIIAKELTLAAIQKLDLSQGISTPSDEHNKYVAEQIAQTFETIYQAVINSSKI